MLKRLKFWTRVRDLAVVAVGLSVLGVLFTLWFRGRGPDPITLRVTTGRLQSERTRLLRALASECRLRNITLELVETRGSEDALLKLASPATKLDLALVQGGLAVEEQQRDMIRQVMTLQDEALHLLVRGDELAHRIENEGLVALRGLRIALGITGSGTARLAREVLEFTGLADDQYQALALDAADLPGLPDPALPDAAFQVAVLPSTSAAKLIQEHGYRLVPLTFDEAFMLWRTPPDGRLGVVHRFVHSITIPAMAYDREPPVPATPLTTLSTRTLLMARHNLPASVVERLLGAVLESPFARFDDPPLEVARLAETPEIAWHEGAVAYRNRNRPLIAEDLLDVLEKEVSVIGALLGASFVLWQSIQKRIHRLRDEGFETYIRKVAAIEREALVLETSPHINLGHLFRLQRQLAELKAEAIERLVGDHAEDVELMTGFITQVNDTRENLTRLILHERENLEEQAREQGLSVQAVWREAVQASTAEHARILKASAPINSPTPESDHQRPDKSLA